MLNSYRKIFPGEIFGKTIQNGKGVEVMWYLLTFIGGLMVGLIIKTIFKNKPKSIGYLNIVNSPEPGEGPYLSLGLDVTVDYIRQQKYATFKVSQK